MEAPRVHWLDMTDDATAAQLRQFAASKGNPCFVCSPHNPHGLQVVFEGDGETVYALFTPSNHHQGWQGVVHGGILAALLDEAMAYALFHTGWGGVTARMNLRYRAPAHAGDALRVESRVVRNSARVADLEGRILRGDTVIVESEARFMKLGELNPEMFQT
jgi:uncharacterized protein (TIGR00369 family)